jgi:GNAT superfamily N-acetyltransferase
VTEIVIKPMRYLAPVSQTLVAATMSDLAERYGGSMGDETPVLPAEFDPPEGGFFVAYVDEWPVGCGGWRTWAADDNVAEIKRMYTRPEARGLGVAKAVLAAVEDAARAGGRKRMILETGLEQPEAMALYEHQGYTPIPSYGYYRNQPGSRCYARDL